ncbi:nitroreductase family protein [Methanobrevibacter sp.]|uniref:nitroreductase family protein n=1 Tax=Methanobrevibacter sp. TaxID=66852 RepID=UPI00388E7226
MSLEEQIYIRKSCRKYLDDEIDMNIIHDFMKSAKPLDDDLKYHYEIFEKDEVKVRNRWSAPYYLALFCDKKEISKVNVGFVFQQLSLFLQSHGIGSCWDGLDSVKGKKPVILIAFGKSNEMTREISSFKRKSLDKISDFEDERLRPAQLAPSAINLQPWYFRHADEVFDVYQVRQNVLKRKIVKKWNPIDVGIALAHMYVANEEKFEFYIKSDFDKLDGYIYIGSIKI